MPVLVRVSEGTQIQVNGETAKAIATSERFSGKALPLLTQHSANQNYISLGSSFPANPNIDYPESKT